MVSCALLGALIALLPPPPTAAATDAKVLRLATTTSTENSGLLNTLLPEFQRDTGLLIVDEKGLLKEYSPEETDHGKTN